MIPAAAVTLVQGTPYGRIWTLDSNPTIKVAETNEGLTVTHNAGSWEDWRVFTYQWGKMTITECEPLQPVHRYMATVKGLDMFELTVGPNANLGVILAIVGVREYIFNETMGEWGL